MLYGLWAKEVLAVASVMLFSLISSFSNFLTFSRLVRYFRLTAPAAVQGHLGAISLKNLTKRKEVRKLEKELIRLNIELVFLVLRVGVTTSLLVIQVTK